MSFGMPSIGTATGTRVDSAAKHIMACKVDSRALQAWCNDSNTVHDKENYIHTNKMKWCMHKDEIVLNTTKKKDKSDGSAKAYPMVVTTLGEIAHETTTYIEELYAKETIVDFYLKWKQPEMFSAATLQSIASSETKQHCMVVNQQIKTLPEFRCQGVALGQAWGSYLSGDTVASVLVGGMMTVLNGHFPMHTGDEVQWYFDFEQRLFHHADSTIPDGTRKPVEDDAEDAQARQVPNYGVPGSKRHKYMDQRLYGGAFVGIGKSSGLKDTKMVARIKPYRMVWNSETSCYSHDHYGDKSRIFAKCISGGRAFDAVDILIMTQSS